MASKRRPIRKVLIANRGEIAVRVIRGCHEMNIATVAVYSEADRRSLHVRMAMEAFCIGPAPSAESYLRADRILEVAKATGADAIHPGYGFLSENAGFARKVMEAGLIWIGPPPDAIDAMGSKTESRARMAAAGVPVVPGTKAALASIEEAQEVAAAVGFPIMLKAAAGGGGKGMRRVFSAEDLPAAFTAARSEARSSFGDDAVYIEKLILEPRHVEVQVLADAHGTVVHLFERDCSIQRRHQKLVEETPAPGVSPEILARTIARVKAAVSALRYRGAGTIEMLQDDDGELWFMEMNTRLQVEHTVTEEVAGVDLVEWQLRVAANEGLDALDLTAAPGGHAVQCRINAEVPAEGFRPQPGVVSRLVLPEGEGIRVDTHLADGDRISPHYDSMFAKVIAHGPDRATALDRLDEALGALVVEGVPTTAPLHRRILAHPDFRSGTYDTRWLERVLPTLVAEDPA
jgi:acetyl-CoA carboxylase biotin carboxylase subunit